MRKLKGITWAGFIITFIVLALFFGKSFTLLSDVAHSNAISVKVESEKVDHLIQLETETKKAGSLTSVKSIPFTQIEDVDVPLRKWANDQEEHFFDEMEQTKLLLDKKVKAHFSLQSTIKPISDHIYNVMMTAEQSVDQENEYHTNKTFTIDLNDEQVLQFQDITKDLDSDKLYKLINKHTDKDLEKEQFDKRFSELENINWTVNKEEMVLYFTSGELTNSDEKISIPLMQFYPYLNDNYYEHIISEELDKKIKQKEEEERIAREKELQQKRATLQQKKYVALTFDDGPNPIQTEKILKTLDDFNAKATFFALSSNVNQNPQLAKKIVDQGHELANHSVTHANLKAVKEKRAKKEIMDSQKTIQEITGAKPKLFRPPYGNFDDTAEELIGKSGQKIILWSVDTEDWKEKNSNAIYEKVKSHTNPGSIILMHDIYPTTADALPKILKYYQQQGYECVTVSELLPYIEDTYNGAYFGH